MLTELHECGLAHAHSFLQLYCKVRIFVKSAFSWADGPAVSHVAYLLEELEGGGEARREETRGKERRGEARRKERGEGRGG